LCCESNFRVVKWSYKLKSSKSTTCYCAFAVGAKSNSFKVFQNSAPRMTTVRSERKSSLFQNKPKNVLLRGFGFFVSAYIEFLLRCRPQKKRYHLVCSYNYSYNFQEFHLVWWKHSYFLYEVRSSLTQLNALCKQSHLVLWLLVYTLQREDNNKYNGAI